VRIQVLSAEQAAKKVDQELQSLGATLKDIESARPFEDLTTTDVARARPQITQAVEEMVKNGKWTTPGYGEKVSFSAVSFVLVQVLINSSFFDYSSEISKPSRVHSRHILRSSLLSLSISKQKCKPAQVHSFLRYVTKSHLRKD
jgi:hypothetical protein